MWYSLLRALFFKLDAETSHYLALKLLKTTPENWIRRFNKVPSHPVKIFGLSFPNPVGLAAGLDKNGDFLSGLQALGFGFVELGTVTPKPQPGNPKPRLFRVTEAHAIINRMGFNNLGVDHLVANLQQRKFPGIVGANIGKNKQTPLELAHEDYGYCLRRVYPWVDYVTVNISSPNTPGLRELQSSHYLHQLLSTLDHIQEELLQQGEKPKPLLIKIDPDLQEQALIEMVSVILDHKVDGMIATNTTLNHRLVAHLRYGMEQGGLSGEPLFLKSTQVLNKLVNLLNGKLPVIAVGGILSADDALEKLAAGASLVQLYTGLIYQGPKLISEIVTHLG